MAQVVENIVWNSTLSTDGATNWNHTTTSNNTQGTFTLSSGKFILFDLTKLSYPTHNIASAQVIFESQAVTAGATAVILLEMLNSSNTQLNSEYMAMSQDYDQIQTEAVRTTSDGSTAWTQNAINTLRIKLTYITQTSGGAGPASTGYMDHFYVRVIYTPTAGLIKLNSGAVKLTNGKINITA